MYSRILVILGLLLLVGSACTSPEARRARGEGAGADVGNRREVVRLHEGAQPYFNTPRIVAGAGGPATIASARQAERLSTSESPSALPR